MISCKKKKQKDINSDINEKIQDFETGKKVYFSMKYPMDNDLHAIDSFFSRILNKNNRSYLLETTISILREIILNASKANYKRIYFEDNNLDINNDEDYDKGMKNFKTALAKQEMIINKLCDSHYWINITCFQNERGIAIEGENNICPTRQERKRINDRINKSQSIHSFTQAYDSIFDTLEGAGLGMLLIYLLMKNAGIDYKLFQITYKKASVKASFSIPFETVKPEIRNKIIRKIIEEVDALPTLPAYIIELQTLCRHPEISIETIAEKISRDPSIAAGLLRLANSAAFITGKKINSLHEAIIIVGLKNIEMLITIAAAKKILENRYNRFRFIWEHCNKCAVYARIIALKKKMKSLADNAYMGGILHDIGKIILLAIEPETTTEIISILENRHPSSSSLLEEITIGISHTDIGAMIAEKWEFPAQIVEPIKNHHAPSQASDEHRGIVMAVYLANLFCNIEDHNAQNLFIEDSVLKFFNIHDIMSLELFHQDLKDTYSQIETLL